MRNFAPDMPHRLPIRNVLKPFRQEHPFSYANAAWIALAATLVVSGMMLLSKLDLSTGRLPEGYHWIFIIATNLVLFVVLMFVIFYVVRNRIGNRHTLLVATVVTVAVVVPYTYGSRWLYDVIYNEELMAEVPMSSTFFKDFTVALVALLITLLLYNISHRLNLSAKAEHLQAENILTHYKALESQVDPHFLFNSLNTLDGLIGLDDDRAHDYLHHLSSSYRYIMHHADMVRLADELGFAADYLYMMQIRYGDALQVEQHVDPALLNATIPPISLQLLIENAVKHNVVSSRHPLTVTIATTTGPEPTIRVSNPLQPKEGDPEPSSGIGLSGLDERCHILFGRGITITRTDATFAVEIPLKA